MPSAGWEDLPGDLAEGDGRSIRARGRGADRDDVAIGEEGAQRAVGETNGIPPVPCELENRTALGHRRSADGARGVKITCPERRTVDRHVGKLLWRRPVHARERRPAHNSPVPGNLKSDIEAPGRRIRVVEVGG